VGKKGDDRGFFFSLLFRGVSLSFCAKRLAFGFSSVLFPRIDLILVAMSSFAAGPVGFYLFIDIVLGSETSIIP